MYVIGMVWLSKEDGHKYCIKFDDVIPTIVQIMEWKNDPALDFDHNDAFLLIQQVKDFLGDNNTTI
tara:strand:- start:7 stop:204 length:198 start_codon:yes stop_codon:yes gene_type:complete